MEQSPKSRFWYSLNPLCWLVYDIFSRAYGNFIMHFVIFVATFVAMIRVDGIFKKKTEKEANEQRYIKA
ncbi:MAG: YgjV family protein [Clostridia bacterium]|nr:YgjV family protein [Clostridia bacterium]